MSAQSSTQNAKVGVEQGGNRMFVKSGGELDIESGGALKIGGVDVTASAGGSGVAGVAAGYKLARSAAPVALDASNPTSVAHGLTTCVAAVACLAGTSAPGDSTSVLSVAINGANLDVYGWKPISGTDPTLVASDGTETFHWIAIGT